MFTNLKVTKIERISYAIYRINSRTTVNTTEPIDKEVVNKYYPLYYNIRHVNCFCRIGERSLEVRGGNITAIIKRDEDNYLIRIYKRYYNGIGQLKTISSTFNTTLEGAVLKIEEIFS